jgi:thiol-disulfide isomerase/thioredoxin
VRTLLGVTFVAVCLTQAGCKTPPRPAPADGGVAPAPVPKDTPFTGAPTAAAPVTAAGRVEQASAGPRPRAGVLAGQVIDETNRRRPGAVIQVLDLDGPRNARALKVLTNDGGYFDVDGLEGGHMYRLVARVQDGVRILTGTQRAVAPNVRVTIYLTTELPLNDTGDKTAVRPAAADAGRSTAVLERPVKTLGEGVTTPVAPARPAPDEPGKTPPLTPPGQGDPSLIAGGAKDPEQFPHAAPANIAGPGRESNPQKPVAPRYTPPPTPEVDAGVSGVTIPLSGPASPAAATPPPPPPDEPAAQAVSLGKAGRPPYQVGDRVGDFTVADFQGRPWEWSQHRAKLMLVDFWFSACGPCRSAIPHLNALQGRYGPSGLRVLGVACEAGPLAEKQQAVRAVQARHPMGYPVLFDADGDRALRKQFAVEKYPTVVLLDASGEVLYRGEGLDPRNAYELETAIRRRLGLPLQ